MPVAEAGQQSMWHRDPDAGESGWGRGVPRDAPDGCAPLLAIGSPIDATIRRRLNRFVVEVDVDGALARAHINNTGRLEQFLTAQRHAFLVRPARPGRTAYRLFAVQDGAAAALIDTRLQMLAFEEAVRRELIPWLRGWRIAARNPRLGDSLVDYRLSREGEAAWLEVKSAVLREGGDAMFPDCPTVRGRRHIAELASLAAAGSRAFILFIAALPDVARFRPYRTADATLCDLLTTAATMGVEVRAIQMVYRPGQHTIVLCNPDLPVSLQ